MKLPCLFAPLVLLIPLRLLAVQADAPDCSAPTPQADMNRCAYEDFLAANGAQAAVLKGLSQALATPAHCAKGVDRMAHRPTRV